MDTLAATAHTVSAAESMKRSAVRLSARPIIRPPHAAAAGLLLSAVTAGDIDRQSTAHSSKVHGAQQQLRAVSR